MNQLRPYKKKYTACPLCSWPWEFCIWVVDKEHEDDREVKSIYKAIYCKYKSRGRISQIIQNSKKSSIAVGPAKGDSGVILILSHCRSTSPHVKGCDRGPKTLCGPAPRLGTAGPTGARKMQGVRRGGENRGRTQLRHSLNTHFSGKPSLTLPLGPSSNPVPLTLGTYWNCNATIIGVICISHAPIHGGRDCVCLGHFRVPKS